MSGRSRSKSPSNTGDRNRSRSPHGDGDVEPLQAVINEREVARKGQDWATADALRDQLRGQGVQIFDKMGLWMTKDGRKWKIGEGSPTPVLASSSHGAISAPSGGGEGEESIGEGLTEITELVNERERARQRKDFEKADEMRNQLKALGATLYDKEKLWKTEDGKLGLIPDWGPPPLNSGEPQQLQPQVKLNEATITMLVDEREDARAAKQWQRADQIRDLLKSKGVQLFDKMGVWRSSTGQGPIIPVNARNAMAGGQAQMGQQMTASAMNQMSQMQQYAGYGMGYGMGGMGQQQAMAASSYPTTDAMKAYWSQMQMGMANPMAQAMAPAMGAGGLGGDDVASLVNQREVARHSKDFQTADQLRDRLRQMGVTMYDKEKRWECSDGRSGAIPPYSAVIQQ